MLTPGDSVLVIGSGPIRIGQGCEFDYSCTQACRALKSEGLKVLLVNPNPATIMTDPGTADVVFLEPLSVEAVTKILREHRPQALLATMGGQEGLNLALELDKRGILVASGTQLLGIKTSTIEIAEDREKFKDLLVAHGIGAIPGCVVTAEDFGTPGRLEALMAGMSFPVIIRASFTLGGGGGGIVRSDMTLREQLAEAFAASQGRPVTIEQSIVGWREFELEVMSDELGTFVVVAAVENIHPMGVHTGDSVTVVPPFTLRDHEFQNMRDVAKRIFAALEMRIGGANIQFAIHPVTGQMVVVEMNPRVSRSSALVSKATGYPIAYISTKLALGHRLDGLTNEITGKTTAAYEPVIDYVAIKMPRFDFEKLAPSEGRLGIAMKSVGEVLSFGSSFAEAMTKAWRGLELGFDHFPSFEDWVERFPSAAPLGSDTAVSGSSLATLPLVKSQLMKGVSVETVAADTGISPFFLRELADVFDAESAFIQSYRALSEGNKLDFAAADRLIKSGYAKSWFARVTSPWVADAVSWLFAPKYRLIDSCAAEFEAKTPYYFSTQHNVSDENRLSLLRKRVVVLGSGPNRIGQGIEFDYACVHAVQALKSLGVQAIMVNCNPETVSTDYLEADKLYIEPLDDEAVLDILRAERPAGVLLQFGGQSPLKLAEKIAALGIPILGSSLESIDLCENREAFESCLAELGVASPKSFAFDSRSAAEASTVLDFYPALIRPSYVIGGQGMTIVPSPKELPAALDRMGAVSRQHPVIVQEFLGDGVEFDVDLLSDGKETVAVGVLRHLDPPGIHSGDSICEWIPREQLEADPRLVELVRTCARLAQRVQAVGLINVQCVLRGDKVFVLEANPRCSRTVPFLAKIQHRKAPFPNGQGIIGAATRICLGASLASLVAAGWEWLRPTPSGMLSDSTGPSGTMLSESEFAFKFPVFPYAKFPEVAVGPGPEMHSLGEVMGRDSHRVRAFYKGAVASGWKFPHFTELKDRSSAGRPVTLWCESEESLNELRPLLGELEYALKCRQTTLRCVTGCVELEGADVLMLPDYLMTCGSWPDLRRHVALALGRGVPAALSQESAILTLAALCWHISAPETETRS